MTADGGRLADELALARRLRLVATDIDGTIVARDRAVSERTLRAFRACGEAGVRVVFVTGRPPRWMAPVAQEAGLTGQAVCANGAVVYDLATRRVLRSHLLAPEVVCEVAARLRPVLPGVGLGVETVVGFRREPHYATRFDTGLEQRVGPLEELVADGPTVVKILAKRPGTSSDEMLRVAREALAGLVSVTHSNAADSLIEIMAPGVSKASTLAEVAAAEGVGPEGVVAFGDMPNDLEMLTWAGRGYAMADGHPAALAAADDVAPDCADDGVAQVVERLLSLRGR
ncbi:HAD family hydrolase [Kineococcus glutinatus]|uniref:HAD family hydrolase n=1 Tax=Kineococcus glutinatus TaxID=1070872 RepID=A0ABP9HBV5_9ACTN